jgi:hypothetical protein
MECGHFNYHPGPIQRFQKGLTARLLKTDQYQQESTSLFRGSLGEGQQHLWRKGKSPNLKKLLPSNLSELARKGGELGGNY